ncbi:MAG TPA: c-type cytochrome [Polyangiales bacterium]|nr:c-type cytochrome [Polyangiales bacterium]
MGVKSRKFWVLLAAALGGGVALLGLLVAASGVIPIKASSGHWAITEWLLHFSMRRSIVTHTLGDELPSLDDPALVLRGAGHYESGCQPCHGGPELHEPRVARAMLPPPPDLKYAADKWEPEELFYIVRHGIKFTGMPAWPTPGRDDEVIAVVAFLEALPKLDAARYRALVYGPAARTEQDRGAQSCARCHGRSGEGRENSAFPKLAQQREGYLLAALDAYADDRRHSGIMQPIAAALDPKARRELAKRYAGEVRQPVTSGAADAERVARGREIALHGIPSQRVPACASCHGPRLERDNPLYPRLAGQHADYLVLQLELFQRNERGGSPRAHLMLKAAPPLHPEQLRDVATFYATLADDDSTDSVSTR